MSIVHLDVEARLRVAKEALHEFIRVNPGRTASEILQVFFPEPYLFSASDMRTELTRGLYIGDYKFRDDLGIELAE